MKQFLTTLIKTKYALISFLSGVAVVFFSVFSYENIETKSYVDQGIAYASSNGFTTDTLYFLVLCFVFGFIAWRLYVLGSKISSAGFTLLSISFLSQLILFLIDPALDRVFLNSIPAVLSGSYGFANVSVFTLLIISTAFAMIGCLVSSFGFFVSYRKGQYLKIILGLVMLYVLYEPQIASLVLFIWATFEVMLLENHEVSN